MEYGLRAEEKTDGERIVTNWHVHGELELLLVLTSDVPCRIDGKEYILEKNSLVLFNNFERHGIGIRGRSYHRLLVMFRPAFLSGLGRTEIDLLECFFRRPDSEAGIIPLTDEQTLSVRQKLEELARLQAGEDAVPQLSYVLPPAEQQLYLRFSLARLLLEVNSLFRSRFGQEAGRGEAYTLISCIIQYIHEHLEETAALSLEAMARHFALSRTSLCSSFCSVTGTSLHQYVIDCRIWRAQELLLTGHSAKETAALTGYPDAAHFSRAFRQRIGLSPMEFVKGGICRP